MNLPSPDRTRGDLLRSLREAQNMDVSQLARQVNLSAGQVLQLEAGELAPGERSLFYTAAIKEKAALKLAQALGADVQTLWATKTAPASQDAGALPDLQILDDLADLLKKQSQARQLNAGERRFSWTWAAGLLAALWLAGAIGYYGQSVSAWFQSQSFLDAARAAAPAETKSPSWIGSDPQAPQMASPSTEVATSPAEPLCEIQAPQTSVTPSQPSKAGNSVHLVALGDLSICVTDGTGKKTALVLKAQESRTVLGKSPWQLRIEKPVPMHMFFQGQKIHWPEGEPSGVLLKEVAGDY
jgi:transcriptional regulator with XRE-family HTH domain